MKMTDTFFIIYIFYYPVERVGVVFDGKHICILALIMIVQYSKY